MKKMLVIGVVLVALLGCGEMGKQVCNECTLPDDCLSGTCSCVKNNETGQNYCWACVPKDYDPLRGSRQSQTYTCHAVTE